MVATIFIATGLAFAETDGLDPAAGEKVDAVLLLDASGSMRLTDPARLRDEGAKLFTQFLKPGDRLAIVEFAQDARVIRSLSDFQTGSEGEIAKNIAEVGNSGTFTDLLVGLQKAQEILQSNHREGAQPVIVLLSDGKMDPDPARGSIEARTEQLKNDFLPELKSNGLKVHTLSFSEQADRDLLAQIAAGSDGVHWFTPTSDKIHESFADLFLVVKKPQVLPMRATGFRIDGDISEATFYINRSGAEQVVVVTPAGKEISFANKPDRVKWFQSQKFDVITIEGPEIGNWQIRGLPKNEGFATVLTSLKLITDWPSNVSSGESVLLQARLFEDEKPISLPKMSEVVKYAFKMTPTDRVSEPVIQEQLYDNGSHGDRIAGDGIHSTTVMLEEPGEYKLRMIAAGPTFERSQEIPFRVKPRLVSLAIVSVEDAATEHGSAKGSAHGADPHAAAPATKDFIRVSLSPEVATLKSVDIKLVAVDADRKRYTIPLVKAGDALRYETPARVLPHDGEYHLQATLSAEGRKKTKIRGVSQEITYNKSSAKIDEHSEEEVVVIAEEKAPEPERPPSPLLYILLVTLANAGLGGFAIMQLSRIKVDSGPSVALAGVDHIIAAIAELESKVKLTEIALDDPLLTSEHARSLSTSVAAPAPAAPAPAAPEAASAESAPPESAAPETEAAEQAEPVAEEQAETEETE